MKGFLSVQTQSKPSGLQKELLRDVYQCDRCSESYGFTRPAPGKPYFKFPPTIGAEGHADLLFVGINPRKTYNTSLHSRLMSDKNEFLALARNRDGQKAYIIRGGGEKHYHHHMAIVEALYGKDARFENHAAVTELYLCATKNAKGLPSDVKPCADLYFDRVFLKVRPKVVICVWKTAFDYFRNRCRAKSNQNFLLTIQDHSAPVILSLHPNSKRLGS